MTLAVAAHDLVQVTDVVVDFLCSLRHSVPGKHASQEILPWLEELMLAGQDAALATVSERWVARSLQVCRRPLKVASFLA